MLYLPYSLIGPFAGVFIDRWSRRQILVWSAVIRAAFVALTAALVASGNLGVPLYASVLAALGVDRFFLSSLSAALPHVVAGDKLVMANSVAPTAGGIMASVGGLVALGVHLVTGGGQGGSAVTLLAAGACYVTAGLVAATMSRELLGPNRTAGERLPGRVLAELAAVAAGLAAGARYLWHRRGPAAALGATGGNRFLYGILFLMSLLLYRNYFYRLAGANAALGSYSLLVAASAVGYASAALVTPAATRRLAKPAWIAILLASAAVVTGPLGATFRPLAVPDHRLRAEPGLPGRRHLLDHDHPGTGGRHLPRPRVRFLRHDVQRHVRGWRGHQRGIHAHHRQVLPPADRRGRRVPAGRRRLPGRQPSAGRRLRRGGGAAEPLGRGPGQQLVSGALGAERAVLKAQLQQVRLGLADLRARADVRGSA